MPTIFEMESKMTLYYSKSTGEIKTTATGIQDMSMFGSDEADFSLIWDNVVLDKDDYVLNNKHQFKINLETKQIEMKPEAIPQYPIASI